MPLPSLLTESAPLSLGQAAKRLGVSQPTVRRWADTGRLEAVKVGSHWRTSEAALARFVARSNPKPLAKPSRTFAERMRASRKANAELAAAGW